MKKDSMDYTFKYLKMFRERKLNMTFTVQSILSMSLFCSARADTPWMKKTKLNINEILNKK
jgi:hypothetical protein